jgi:hypothetical protein
MNPRESKLTPTMKRKIPMTIYMPLLSAGNMECIVLIGAYQIGAYQIGEWPACMTHL